MVQRRNMSRLETIAESLPEAQRVDIAEWGDHPSFRVRGKNFVLCDTDATTLTVKLGKSEAAAVVATEPGAAPAGYGLGRHGWVVLTIPDPADDEYWAQLREWVVTSYCLVAPRSLARLVQPVDGG